MLTVNELAKMLRLDIQTIYRKVKKGEIPYVRIGGRGSYRFKSEEIDRWMLTNAIPSARKGVI
jgi:excisionase family DNA binding protein